MTHTLHRTGDSDALAGEFIVLAMIVPALEAQASYCGPQGDRIRRLFAILAAHAPAAIAVRSCDQQLMYSPGCPPLSSESRCSVALSEMGDLRSMQGFAHAVYLTRESLRSVLEELRAADLGISIVVSGLFDEIRRVCRAVGIVPHSVDLSLEFWGQTERLPEARVLDLVTMCGHALVAPRLARRMMHEVRDACMSAESASLVLARQCLCNVFNTDRAATLLQEPGDCAKGRSAR